MIRYTEQRVPEGFLPLSYELGRDNAWIERLEAIVGQHHDCYAVAVSSGTMGVLLSLQALSPRVVQVPNNTFVGVLNAARLSHHQFEITSCNEHGLLKVCQTNESKARIALLTNIGGELPLSVISTWHDAAVIDQGLTIVQDMSHDPKGHFLTCAMLGVMSFDFCKPVSTYEGGVVLTRDSLMLDRLLALRDNGRYQGAFTGLVGCNGHMTASSAHLAYDSWLACDFGRVMEIRQAYDDALGVIGKGGSYLYFLERKDPDALRNTLQEANIESPQIYPPFAKEESYFSAQHLVLPMHRWLTDEDVEKVIRTVK